MNSLFANIWSNVKEIEAKPQRLYALHRQSFFIALPGVIQKRELYRTLEQDFK